MFWRRREAVTVEVPVPFKMNSMYGSDLAKYKSIASRIDLKTPALVEADILTVCDFAGVYEYDYVKVSSYLTEKFARWHWAPLREKESAVVASAVSGLPRYDQPRWLRGASDDVYTWAIGILDDRQYPEPVPYPVLARVEPIVTAVPEALFFVSYSDNVKVKRGSTFLMVCVEGGAKRFVIEHWDAPSF